MRDSQENDHDEQPPLQEQEGLDGETVEALDPTNKIVHEMNRRFKYFDQTQDEVLSLLEKNIESAVSFGQTVAKARSDFEASINGVLEDEEIVEAFEHLVFVAGSEEGNLSSGEITAALDAVKEVLPPEQRPTYLGTLIRNLRRVPSDRVHMYPGFLTMLVSQVEVAIRGYTEAVTRQFPETVIGSEDSIAVKDLDKFTTVDEVKMNFVQNKVDKVLRGSLQDWVKFFVEKLKIDAKSVVSTPDVVEVAQRRHCFIHNDGKASGLYIANTARRDVSEGEYLAVDPEYLRKSADLLYVFLFSLHCAVAGKLAGKNRDAKNRLGQFVQITSLNLLRERRYEVLKLIDKSKLSLRIETQDASILKVNIWLAYKFSGEFEMVKDEIEKLDTREIPINIRLAKAALLDDHERAVDLIEAMLVTKDIRKEHILTWPLLREVYPVYKKRQASKTEG